MTRNAGVRIAVVGAGFSGSLTAIHLLRQCGDEDRVYLIERAGRMGRGVAYGTPNPDHLLNVRAENMSAFPDRPTHFVEWLAEQQDQAALGAATPAGTFVRRQLYGNYVRDQLAHAMHREGGSRRLFIVADAAVGLHRHAHGITIEAEGGRRYEVDAVVLALGNFPPDHVALPGYVSDPWSAGATRDLDPEAPVLLLGTGLTMVDVAMTLLESPFRGTIHALSRRGLLPHAHAPAPRWDGLRLDAADRASIATLVRAVRREVARAGDAGVGWRSVIDALRPHTQLLWQELSRPDRQRFLRHLRPWWDIHRHRVAPPVAATLRASRDSGRLVIHTGKIAQIDERKHGLAATWRPRRETLPRRLEVQRIVNCTGVGMDYTAIADPLVRQLLGSGHVRADACRLGLDCTTQGALVGRDGEVAGDLFAVGPVTRGAFWEIVAVPDIRVQAAAVARTALDSARRVVARRPADAA